jgi:group I intron endonuclease
MSEEFYVYIIYENTVPIYIGKGHRDRLQSHLQPCNLKKNSPIYKKLREVISRGIEPDIEKVNEFETEGEAFEEEIRLIRFYGRRCNGTGTLFNMTDGGEGQSGRECSEETKIKMSIAHTGKKHSEETKIKMSISAMGHKLSEKTLEKLSLARKEQSERITAAIRISRGFPVLRKRFGKVIKRYNSVSEVEEDGMSRTTVTRAISNESYAYGTKWEYENT